MKTTELMRAVFGRKAVWAAGALLALAHPARAEQAVEAEVCIYAATPSGTSFVTTEAAPMTACRPTRTPGSTVAPAPIHA